MWLMLGLELRIGLGVKVRVRIRVSNRVTVKVGVKNRVRVRVRIGVRIRDRAMARAMARARPNGGGVNTSHPTVPCFSLKEYLKICMYTYYGVHQIVSVFPFVLKKSFEFLLRFESFNASSILTYCEIHRKHLSNPNSNPKACGEMDKSCASLNSAYV